MPRVFLVNPARVTAGYSFFTPRWLYVLAGATPSDVDSLTVVDETLTRFDASRVGPGDIVGIGISSGNCVAGYRVAQAAKASGATVVMGGIHCTIFPEEPLRHGADAVVTGNGDRVWTQVIQDFCTGRLQRRYDGGRIPGSAMAAARWDLMDARRYLFPTVQTVAGCPENCSFCSVWVTDGREPRLREHDALIRELRQLHALGFRFVAFADDNFNPATLARIAREPSASKRRQLEQIRRQRIEFFEEMNSRVPPDLYAITQMTCEVAEDEEYFTAMRDKGRIRAALLGIESFSEEGLSAVNKSWNPSGERTKEMIGKIQDRGILVLSSIITGLPTDDAAAIRQMADFAIDSGTLLAQFTLFNAFPGTKDFLEMVQDRRRRDEIGYVPKQSIQLLDDAFWLRPKNQAEIVKHPRMSREDWLDANRDCWDRFYSLRASIRRVLTGPARRWPFAGRITYIFACLAFRRVYRGDGLSADSVNRNQLSWSTRLMVTTGMLVYNRWIRKQPVVRLAGPAVSEQT